METAVILRGCLVAGAAGMIAIALSYLYRRQLVWWEKCFWTVLVVGVPLLGPFIMLICRPGERKQRYLLRRARQRRYPSIGNRNKGRV